VILIGVGGFYLRKNKGKMCGGISPDVNTLNRGI